MNSELIMNSDVLDILFEKRNKLYGAYTLRKFYNNRLMKAVGATLTVAVILSAFTFIREKAVTLIPTTEVSFGIVSPPKPVEPIKEIPKEPTKSTLSSQ